MQQKMFGERPGERDVVCGLDLSVNENAVLRRQTWEGRTYFFCSSACAQAFRAAPAAYGAAPTAVSELPHGWQGGRPLAHHRGDWVVDVATKRVVRRPLPASAGIA